MISVVIPSYKRKDSVLRLLADVYRQEGVEFEVIVVDDNSLDGTVEAIRAAYPQTVLLRNEVNSGPAVTRNRGVRHAKAEIIVGFDSDVTAPDKLLLKKVAEAFAAAPKASGFAFRLLQPDGKSEDRARWWHPVPIEKFASKSFLTCYFSGTAYAFRKQAMLDAGLFPEILFMHYEEVWMAWRILDIGGDIFYSPDLYAVHHENQLSRRSEIRTYYKPRNQILLAMGCLPLWEGLIYVLPRLGYQLLRALKDRHVRFFAAAVRDAWQHRSQCREFRRPLSRLTLSRLSSMRFGILRDSNGAAVCPQTSVNPDSSLGVQAR
jgi:GT2 family glycosyltransferase